MKAHKIGKIILEKSIGDYKALIDTGEEAQTMTQAQLDTLTDIFFKDATKDELELYNRYVQLDKWLIQSTARLGAIYQNAVANIRQLTIYLNAIKSAQAGLLHISQLPLVTTKKKFQLETKRRLREKIKKDGKNGYTLAEVLKHFIFVNTVYTNVPHEKALFDIKGVITSYHSKPVTIKYFSEEYAPYNDGYITKNDVLNRISDNFEQSMYFDFDKNPREARLFFREFRDLIEAVLNYISEELGEEDLEVPRDLQKVVLLKEDALDYDILGYRESILWEIYDGEPHFNTGGVAYLDEDIVPDRDPIEMIHILDNMQGLKAYKKGSEYREELLAGVARSKYWIEYDYKELFTYDNMIEILASALKSSELAIFKVGANIILEQLLQAEKQVNEILKVIDLTETSESDKEERKEILLETFSSLKLEELVITTLSKNNALKRAKNGLDLFGDNEGGKDIAKLLKVGRVQKRG